MISDSDILELKKISTATAARYLNIDDVTLRMGLQQKAFPFGTAFLGTNGRYIYDIRPEALVHYKHHGMSSPDIEELASAIGLRLMESLKITGGLTA